MATTISPSRSKRTSSSPDKPPAPNTQGKAMIFSASIPAGAKKTVPTLPPKDPSLAVPGVTVVVEPAADVARKDGETFVTQRAGKIVQNPQIPTLPPERSYSMFESRRALQSTLLLQKKKEMQAVQAQLEKKRAEFAKRMEECRERQEDLRTKQKQIRDRVTKFEKFLKENDAKRQRANLKAQTEKKLKEQKEQELGALHRQFQQEQAKHAQILQLIKKYQIYETYLQSVISTLPPDYLDINEPHINDILMRHKTLVETNQDLLQSVSQSQDDIERENARLAELVKEKNDLILVYNSTLGTLQKRLDGLKQECAYAEQRLQERDNTGKERMRMLSETKLAINNIFDRVGLRPHSSLNPPQPAPTIAPVATTTPVLTTQTKDHADNSAKALAERLHAIQDRVLDLQHIAQRAEQMSLGQDGHHPPKAKRHAPLATTAIPQTDTAIKAG